jgi:hypothetical protein
MINLKQNLLEHKVYLLIFVFFLHFQIQAQLIAVTDMKGTISEVRNTQVTTATTAPTTPLEGDIWIQTTTGVSNVWDADTTLWKEVNTWLGDTASTINWLGATITADTYIRVQGNLTIRNGILRGYDTGRQFKYNPDGAAVDIQGLEMNGVSMIPNGTFGNDDTFERYRPRGASLTFAPEGLSSSALQSSKSILILENLDDSENPTGGVSEFWHAHWGVIYKNSKRGGNTGIDNLSGGANNYSFVEQTKELKFITKELNNNLIQDSKIFIEEYPFSETISNDDNNFHERNWGPKSYTATTNASGEAEINDILYKIINKRASVAPQIVYVEKDGLGLGAMDAHFWSYNHFYQILPDVSLDGIGQKEIETTLFTDINITETDKIVVDAYTSIDNLDKLYDRAKSWKVTSVNLEYPTINNQPVTVDGKVLDLGNINLIIGATAASAFAINQITNTISIKTTAALEAGTSFNSIKTTGAVSAVNGASLEFGYEDSSGAHKYVSLSNIVSADTILIRDNILGTDIISVTGISGVYETFFLAPTDASDITVNVTRSNYSSFSENYPENELGFERSINLQLTQLIAELQIEILNLTHKILQKEETLYRAFDLTNPTTTITTTAGPSTGLPSVENQQSILDMLNKVFIKVIGNKRKLKE